MPFDLLSTTTTSIATHKRKERKKTGTNYNNKITDKSIE